MCWFNHDNNNKPMFYHIAIMYYHTLSFFKLLPALLLLYIINGLLQWSLLLLSSSLLLYITVLCYYDRISSLWLCLYHIWLKPTTKKEKNMFWPSPQLGTQGGLLDDVLQHQRCLCIHRILGKGPAPQALRGQPRDLDDLVMRVHNGGFHDWKWLNMVILWFWWASNM